MNEVSIQQFQRKLEDFAGNRELKDYLRHRLALGAVKHPNLLITGDPGTGKTSTALVFFKELLGDDYVGERDYDLSRYWVDERLFRFLRIDGGTDSRGNIESSIVEAKGVSDTDYVYVLIDEIGSLWSRKLDETLRPLLDAAHISVIATAQDFKGVEKDPDDRFAQRRWEALDRRFPMKIATALPGPQEMALHLARALRWLGMKVDSPRTLLTLARKHPSPSRSLNVITAIHCRGRDTLTAEDVAEA